MDEVLVDSPRGRFGARVAGPAGGRPMLCVHGFPDNAGSWDGLAAALAARGHRIVAPYLRGHHPSPIGGDLSLGALADDIARVIGRHPRQWWMSRYIAFFQAKGVGRPARRPA